MTSVVRKEKSRSSSFADYLPLKLVRYLASPYIAGQDSNAVIIRAQQLFKEQGICSTFDILGENVYSAKVADCYVKIYQDLIDDLVAQKLPIYDPRKQITLSMKPSMFSVVSPRANAANKLLLDEAFDRIAHVVDYAFSRGVNMTLEAEDRRWTNFQLETYFALVQAGYSNLGTVLQTRLFRTEKDIGRFTEKDRVRLVIGIYEEPPEAAYTDKRKMKDLLVKYAGQLLRKGSYVELATHDRHYIERFFAEIIIPRQVPTSQFETQFLLGVPRSELQTSLVDGQFFRAWQSRENSSYLDSLMNSGVLVRMYLPFGDAAVAGPYCKRRLRENHNLIIYGIKNILRWK
jgi:proline dehydrogenase